MMSTLNVSGAQLYYEVTGDGPLMILIPGASGEAEVFQEIARPLAERYRVVTYDRRGFSRSALDGPQDYDHRLDTDAKDVRQLIKHLTNQPATIFGNSSGAIVALQVLSRYPEQVQRVVAHEPPTFNLAPDGAKWLAFFDAVYETYRQQGAPKAMHQFASGTVRNEDHRRNMKEQPMERRLANATYWLEHELRQYPRADLDIGALSAHTRQLVLAGGRNSRGQMTYQPNKALAQKLGLDIKDFPGGHLGFLAYPAEFAQALMNILKS